MAIERRAATSNTIVAFSAAALVGVVFVTVGIVFNIFGTLFDLPLIGVQIVVIYTIHAHVTVCAFVGVA